MKQAKLGAIIRYGGELHEVIAESDGHGLILAPVDKDACPTCGSRHHVHLLESSPLFQDNAEPVQTLEGS